MRETPSPGICRDVGKRRTLLRLPGAPDKNEQTQSEPGAECQQRQLVVGQPSAGGVRQRAGGAGGGTAGLAERLLRQRQVGADVGVGGARAAACS